VSSEWGNALGRLLLGEIILGGDTFYSSWYETCINSNIVLISTNLRESLCISIALPQDWLGRMEYATRLEFKTIAIWGTGERLEFEHVWILLRIPAKAFERRSAEVESQSWHLKFRYRFEFLIPVSPAQALPKPFNLPSPAEWKLSWFRTRHSPTEPHDT